MKQPTPPGDSGAPDPRPLAESDPVCESALLSSSGGLEEFGSETDEVPAAPATVVRSADDSGGSPLDRAVLRPGRETAPPQSVSIADLMENSVPVDWHEAVAIAQRICQTFAQHPASPAQQVLIEPRHVEITERGSVQVSPGGPGADPVVKQVGRILRALLEGEGAPVQLRLLASQAAFEVPGFSSVQELSDALRRFEDSGEPDILKTTFQRVLDAKFSAPAGVVRDRPLAASRPASFLGPDLPERAVAGVEPLVEARRRNLLPVAVGLCVSVLAAVALLTMSWDAPTRIPLPVPQVADASNAPLAASNPDVPPAVATTKLSAAPVPSIPVPQSGGNVAVPGSSTATRRPVPFSRLPPPASVPAQPSAVAPSSPMPPVDVPDAPADRALALFRAGRTEDAQMVVDSIVLADPLYQPYPGRSTPAMMSALQTSRRLVLPVIAARDLEKARAALDAGDYDRALVEGDRLANMLAVLDNAGEARTVHLAVQQLLAAAAVERTRAEQRVYSTADVEVTPPAALGRQLPARSPRGVPSPLLGTLELLINRAGEVESIKLHTPLNRYHERMIVSAAKAWRYRPALKNGKPVRFLLVSSITLPES